MKIEILGSENSLDVPKFSWIIREGKEGTSIRGQEY